MLTNIQNHLARKAAICLAGLVLSLGGIAQAAEFLSVNVPQAVSFDAPSEQAIAQYRFNKGTPLEVVLKIEGWIKVRDQYGVLQWFPANQLGFKRMVLIKKPTAVLMQSPQNTAPAIAKTERDVMFELVGVTPVNGWIKVKHEGGTQGYLPIDDLWGI